MGISFNTGNIYMKTPTGWEPMCAINDIVDVTNTLDEAYEEEKAASHLGLWDYEVSATFTMHPRSHSRFYRTMRGWKASGPMRHKQIWKCYNRGMY